MDWVSLTRPEWDSLTRPELNEQFMYKYIWIVWRNTYMSDFNKFLNKDEKVITSEILLTRDLTYVQRSYNSLIVLGSITNK
jgi:hypothetical protein